jgi:hypothetical protein
VKLNQASREAIKSMISRAAPERFSRGEFTVIDGIEGIADFREAPHCGSIVLPKNTTVGVSVEAEPHSITVILHVIHEGQRVPHSLLYRLKVLRNKWPKNINTVEKLAAAVITRKI